MVKNTVKETAMVSGGVSPMGRYFLCALLLAYLCAFASCSRSSEKPAAEKPSASGPRQGAPPSAPEKAVEPAAAKAEQPLAESSSAGSPGSGVQKSAPPKAVEPAAARAEQQQASVVSDSALMPIAIQLPKPMFVGTPQNIAIENLEKPLGKPRPPFLAPVGTTNVALGKRVTSSDNSPIIGEVECITDGNKDSSDGNYVQLGPGVQHITIDLEKTCEIYAIVVWHLHKQPVVFFDVVVQSADDAHFIENVKTLFNNDIDNSSGLGIGKNMHYTETNEGKLIDARSVRARYIRLYSNGYSLDDTNYYTEVEVYGRPIK